MASVATQAPVALSPSDALQSQDRIHPRHCDFPFALAIVLDVVRMWLGCGSDVVQMWLRHGLDVALRVFGCGTDRLAEVKGQWLPALSTPYLCFEQL